MHTKRRRNLPLAGALALAALLACANEPPGPAAAAPPAPGQSEFDDTLELLGAIREGSFARRVGLLEEIREAQLPPPMTIEFVSGTRVPDAEQDELRELADRLAGREHWRVDLVGCSDPPGSEALNLRISQSRAESVAARLVELGVPESQLGQVVGRGEDCPEQERMVRVVAALADDAQGED